jgi:hypothetical protein
MFLREAKMNSSVLLSRCLSVCAQRSERNAQSMYFVLPLSRATGDSRFHERDHHQARVYNPK